jgi:hypothetical protein
VHLRALYLGVCSVHGQKGSSSLLDILRYKKEVDMISRDLMPDLVRWMRHA